MSTTRIVIGVGCGILGAVLVLVGGCLACAGYFVAGTAEIVEDTKDNLRSAFNSPYSMLRFEEVESQRSGGAIEVSGHLRFPDLTNNLQRFVDVKVGVDWLDADDNVVDKSWTFLENRQDLLRGEAMPFKIVSRQDERIEAFRTYVLEN